MTAPTNSPVDTMKQWQDEVNQLSHKIFFQTTEGQRLLFLLEQRYFYSPVSDPHVSPRIADFNEGRNSHIRSYRAWAYQAMRPKQPTQITQEIDL